MACFHLHGDKCSRIDSDIDISVHLTGLPAGFGVTTARRGFIRRDQQGMKLKSVLGTAVLAIGTTLAGLMVATPAFAARADDDQLWRGDNHYHAWVNNGNRTIRLQSEGYGFHIDFYEYNTAGNRYVLYVDSNKDWTWYLPQPVSLWRLCGPNGGGGDDCTRWHNLDR